MSRSIDDIDFDLFYGRVANLKTRCDVFDIFGHDGIGVQTGGEGDAEFQLRTVYFAENANDSDNHITNCEALQGTLVTVVDAFGTASEKCLVVHVDTDECQKAVIYGNNPDAVRTEIKWRLVRCAQ